MRSTDKSITFVLFNKINIEYENKKKLALTEIEFDMIESGRNYRKSYPNGDPELRYYLERLFVEWLEGNED